MTSIEVFHAIIKGEFKGSELVTILELAAIQLEINTISEMARKEGKSPNGIKKSKRYKKIKIGKQLMVIKL